MLLWLLVARPLKEPILLRMEIFNECCLIGLLGVFIFLYYAPQLRYYGPLLGWISVSVILLCMIVNFAAILPKRTIETLKRWRKYCISRKNRKVADWRSRATHFAEANSLASLAVSLPQ